MLYIFTILGTAGIIHQQCSNFYGFVIRNDLCSHRFKILDIPYSVRINAQCKHSTRCNFISKKLPYEVSQSELQSILKLLDE